MAVTRVEEKELAKGIKLHAQHPILTLSSTTFISIKALLKKNYVHCPKFTLSLASRGTTLKICKEGIVIAIIHSGTRTHYSVASFFEVQ